MKERLVKNAKGDLILIQDKVVKVVVNSKGDVIKSDVNCKDIVPSNRNDKVRFWRCYAENLARVVPPLKYEVDRLTVAGDKHKKKFEELQGKFHALLSEGKMMQERVAEAIRVNEQLTRSNEQKSHDLNKKEEIINHLRKLNTDLRAEYEAKMVQLEMNQGVVDEKKGFTFLGVRVSW